MSSQPENVIVLPSARLRVDGYQRPRAMSCTCVKRSVVGSKMVVVRMPVKGLYCMLPPTVSTRPSGRKLIALQKRSQGIVCTVKMPVVGSYTAAR